MDVEDIQSSMCNEPNKSQPSDRDVQPSRICIEVGSLGGTYWPGHMKGRPKQSWT